jgi:hypothetical protein
MSIPYETKPEDKFIFGLWTVGSIGREPFGGPVRLSKTPIELVSLLGEAGAYGINFYDNDLIPIDAVPAAFGAHSFDPAVVAGRGLKYECLDHLMIELPLGAR